MVRSAVEKSAAFFRVIVVFKEMEEPDSCIKTSSLSHKPVMETIIKGISSKIKSIRNKKVGRQVVDTRFFSALSLRPHRTGTGYS
ncbi:MAG TPA: hypothetical protein DD414_05775 [Lachnospiraceae bacterium]|nr:hypothetical protein [Lachnospiraceae bacterium]